MKTLMQVEPRTPIASAPYTITQPGSYYLTTNLIATEYGITVQANRVALDLMGFSITGPGAQGFGIRLLGTTNAALREIVVRNGMVSGFQDGVYFGYVQNGRIEHLTVSSNSMHGVTFDGSYGGACDGNTIAHCAISRNADYAVGLIGTSGRCDGNTVRDCTIRDNPMYGVLLNGYYGQCGGNTVRDCTISDNGFAGVDLNGSFGQCHGNTVCHCTIRNNASYGICVMYSDGNRIENNHVSGATGATSWGIKSEGSSANLILQNTCVGQPTNYAISANDTCGPIVTESGTLATTNGAAALSPWANFSR